MVRTKIWVTLILWIFAGPLLTYGQARKVGDYFVPSGEIKVYDAKTDSIHALVTGRPMLLDFGSTTCAPCLKSFGIISMLKDQFGHAFDAYMVTRESFDRAAGFGKRRVQMDMPVLPIVYGDTLLNALFPHYAEPHLVWIDSKGKVLAITDHEQLDSNSVGWFLSGQKLAILQKWDYPYDHKNSMMVFRPDNLRLGMVPRVFEQTVVGGIVPHVIPRGGVEIDSVGGFIRYYAYNEPFVNLYLLAFGKKWKYKFPSSHILWDKEIKWQVDVERTTLAPVSDSLALYSYEMVFPLGYPLSFYGEKVKNRLDDYFGVQTTMAFEERDCLVIEIGGPIKIEEKNRSKTNLNQVLDRRNNRFGTSPIIDETGLSSQEKMKIPVDRLDLKDDNFLKNELERIGFKVSAQVRSVETLRFSIRDK